MVVLPSGVDINNLIDDLRTFSWEAAKILIYYSKMFKDPNVKAYIMKNKKDESPVTKADLEANDLIIRSIKEKYKDISWEILSEETVNIESENIDINAKWLWVLDPLDGTKDFIQGTENYALHLALNYEQNPSIGIVLIPEKDELWVSNGTEVWCESKDGLQRKPKLSNNTNLSEMTLVTSKNHNNEVLKKLIEKIHFKKIVVMGSIGCKITSILRGESDLYLCLSLPGKSAPKDWDFAAPEAILRAFGGAITYLDNEDLVYNQKNFEQKGIIIATSNRETHAMNCSQVKEIIRKYNLFSY